MGFPLAKLLREVEPTSEAKYVRFETLLRPGADARPETRDCIHWPYVEGLRLDEAMHDLTILATGLYGKPLLPQNGAPIRAGGALEVRLQEHQVHRARSTWWRSMPVSFWMAAAPKEYGFYANVNPDVPHPRWSQATERRIGELRRRETLLFNGYAEEVAQLYAGMDLKENY